MANEKLNKFEGKFKFIEISLGIFGVVTSVSSYITKLSSTLIAALVLSVSLMFLFHYLGNRFNKEVLIDDKPVVINKKLFYLFKTLMYSMLVPIIFISYLVIFPNEKKCDNISKSPLICITKFSDNKDDEFSYSLIEKLNSDIRDTNIFSICFIDTFLNQSFILDPSQSTKLLNQKCHDKGLIVFGRRSEASSLFNCTIFISELLKKDFLSSNSKDIIKLKNPDEINFSIEKQTDCVSKFILSLSNFYSKKYNNSLNYLTEIENCLNDNSSFAKICNIYMAHSLYALNRKEECIKIYNEKINIDNPTSVDLNNLAIIYLNNNDSTNAFLNFENARKTDSKIVNPLSDYKIKTDVTENEITKIKITKEVSKDNFTEITPNTKDVGLVSKKLDTEKDYIEFFKNNSKNLWQFEGIWMLYGKCKEYDKQFKIKCAIYKTESSKYKIIHFNTDGSLLNIKYDYYLENIGNLDDIKVITIDKGSGKEYSTISNADLKHGVFLFESIYPLSIIFPKEKNETSHFTAKAIKMNI
jgi:tetratricopeptide (TPR) repeat protein